MKFKEKIPVLLIFLLTFNLVTSLNVRKKQLDPLNPSILQNKGTKKLGVLN